MKVVGRAMSTYGRRMLIIQCDAAQLPGLNSEVMDRRTKPAGKIMDIFGNVKSPYALVLTSAQNNVRPGEKVYAKEPQPSSNSRLRTQR